MGTTSSSALSSSQLHRAKFLPGYNPPLQCEISSLLSTPHVSQMAQSIHFSQPKNAITSFVGYIFPHLLQNVVSVHTCKFTTKGAFSKKKSVLVAQILDPICFDNWCMLGPYKFSQVKNFARKLAQLLPPWTSIYRWSSLSQNISIFRITISW